MQYLDKPWLQSYKLGPYKLPHSLAPYPVEPAFAALDHAAENYPGQTALLFCGRALKYAQLRTLTDRLAASLARMGVQKGDRVCLFLPNCAEFILSDWAVMKAGGVVVPTSTLRTEEGLLHEAASSNSKIIICREEHLERALAVWDRCDVEHVIVTSTAGYDVEGLSTPLPDGVHEFRTLLAENNPRPQIDIDPAEDLCELAFTGGATGIPKGVMLTHSNRLSSLLQGFPWLMHPLLRGFVGKSSVMIPISLFHAYGRYVHHSAAYLGMRVILMADPRDIPALVSAIQEHRPLLMPAVPTQYMRIAERQLRRMNVMLLSGSAPLPDEVAQAVKARVGMPISEGYGLTETSSISHFNLSAFSRITGFMQSERPGIGVPCPDTECRLVDPDSGVDVPSGSPGELIVRGPQVMKGYWPTPGAGLTPDGWLHTGDIAVMDEEGYFQIVDRIKDMVNVSGMKVYTTTVDEVLFRHPAVLMAAAFGVPDPRTPGSERVMAVVQLREEHRGRVTEDEIREFCREHLAPYAVPKYVEFRDELPLTATEKVYKKALRDEATAKLAAGEAQAAE